MFWLIKAILKEPTTACTLKKAFRIEFLCVIPTLRAQLGQNSFDRRSTTWGSKKEKRG
jgi:hypothetical protein